MTGFRLAHLSDLHLPPPALPLHRLAPKQWLSLLAWRRKRHRHRIEVLNAIAADVAEAAPDHVAITGDLTNFATAPEFDAAAQWLRSLGDPSKVTVSPGNHDALTGRGGAARFAPWQAWLGDSPDIVFPMVRRRGRIAIFNLCSALPTALHKAQGRLGDAQLDRLGAGLTQAGEEGLTRVILVHHPITHGVVAGRSELVDRQALGQVLARTGGELVLHGHAHAAAVSTLPGPNGRIPVLGVPSASAAHGHGEAARWHMIEIGEGQDPSIRLTARGLEPSGRAHQLGRYALAPA